MKKQGYNKQDILQYWLARFWRLQIQSLIGIFSQSFYSCQIIWISVSFRGVNPKRHVRLKRIQSKILFCDVFSEVKWCHSLSNLWRITCSTKKTRRAFSVLLFEIFWKKLIHTITVYPNRSRYRHSNWNIYSVMYTMSIGYKINQKKSNHINFTTILCFPMLSDGLCWIISKLTVYIYSSWWVLKISFCWNWKFFIIF